MKSRLQQTQTPYAKQIQRLILSPQMQQALNLLQLPVLELSCVIQEELMQNPILELDNETGDDALEVLRQIQEEMRVSKKIEKREEEDLKAFIENTLAYEHSLFDHLMDQAREHFKDPHDLLLAEWIIGNLDANGFLTTQLEELALLSGSEPETLAALLKDIQTFDPFGIGAKNTQESLLIQLRNKGKEDSLAFRILQDHYDDVLHNRIPAIAKALSRTHEEIYHTISEEISLLELHPGANESQGHYRQIVQHVVPDVSIHWNEEKFTIAINDEKLPSLRVSHNYLKMLEDSSLPEETRSYIQEKIASGKWLLRNLHERHQTLYRIAEELIETQGDFLSKPEGKLTPITMKDIAEKLSLHESTIARAVANKYLSCPKGVLPLRSFFTHAYIKEDGENISSETVKDLLKEIIAKENKKKPLSDEVISTLIKEKGIVCARRTVAKYREELGIGNTIQRKIH